MNHFQKNINNQAKGKLCRYYFKYLFNVKCYQEGQHITCYCSRKSRDPNNHDNMKIIRLVKMYVKTKQELSDYRV